MPRLVALLALLLLVGCGNGDDTSSPATTRAGESSPHVVDVSKPSGTEREYLNTVGEWVLACTGTVEEYAGEPPTERMRTLARQATAACGGNGKTDAVLTRIAGYELHWGDSQKLPVKGGRTEVSRVEPRFSEATAKLTGKETEVRCWSEEDWRAVASAGSPYDEGDSGASELAGFVGDDRRIHLAPDVCADLVDLAYGDGKAGGMAFAVAALAHEARHTMGELREDRTECWAVQNVERTAALLGASADRARELASAYWKGFYPLQEPPYWSDECRDGGELDLRPDDDRWP